MTGPRRAIILSLLVVGFGVAIAAGGAPVSADGAPIAATDGDGTLLQPVETTPNTTRSLSVDSVDGTGSGSASVSVTKALQAETGTVEAKLDQQSVENQLRTADTDAEAVLAAAFERTHGRLDTIETREAAARDRFRGGEIDVETYLDTLGAVNRQAQAMERTLAGYEELTEDHPSLQDQVAALETRTVRYTGPIGDDVGAAVTGGEQSGSVFVTTGENGLALATLTEERYTREVMRTDARDEAVGGVDLDAAQTRIAELYPWAWEHKGDVSINTVGQDVFRFQLSHGHGELNSLLDTSSGNVYREIQWKSLQDLPVSPGPSKTVENTTLQVSEPQPGEPVRIQVVNRSGAPLPGTVSVDGRTLGDTAAGPVWLIGPTEPFNVTASTTSETLELEVQPESRQ